MLKFVWKDYKGQFKSGLKETYNEGWFVNVYLIICPFTFWVAQNKVDLLIYYCGMFPIAFGLFLSRMYPNQMSKTLLLCPLTIEEKRAYILTGYRFRVLVTLGVAIVLNGIPLVMGLMHPIYFIGLLFITGLYTAAVNIYCRPSHYSSYAMERKYNLPGNYEVWNIAIQLGGIFGTMDFIAAIGNSETPVSILDIVLLVCCVLVVGLLALKFFCTYYKPVMEQALVYDENRMHVKKEK